MADKEMVEIRFTEKMLNLMEKKEQLNNPNPISEAQSTLFSKENKKEKEELEFVMNLMMTNDSLARLLDNPNMLRQMVKSQGIFPFEREAAERLVNAGLATSEALEKHKEKTAEEKAMGQKDDSVPTQNIEEAAEEKKEDKKDQKQFTPENDEDTPSEIKALNEQIKTLEEAEKDKEDDQRAIPLIKKQKQELAEKRNEMYGKFFYLTPERMFENLEHMNNGRVLDVITNGDVDKKNAIRRAYLTCSDPAALQNPDFLTERLEKLNLLPEGKQVSNLKALHMMTLMSTYVGYHEEEVVEKGPSESVDVKDPSMGQQVDNAQVQFPTFADQLPYSIKKMIADMIRQKEKEIIGQKLITDPSQAEFVMGNMDLILDAALEQLEATYGRDQVGKGSTENAIAAYIKVVRETRERDQLEVPDELDAHSDAQAEPSKDNQLEISAETLSTDSGIEQTAQNLKAMSSNNPENNSLNTLSKVSVNIVVNAEPDLEQIDKIVTGLRETGIEVEIKYAYNTGEVGEIQQYEERIASIKSSSGSVKLTRDEGAEMSLAVDRAVTGAIQNWALSTIREIAMAELGEALEGPLEDIFAEMLTRYPDRDSMINRFNFIRHELLHEHAAEIDAGRETTQQAINAISVEGNIPPHLVAAALEELVNERSNEENPDPFANMFRA